MPRVHRGSRGFRSVSDAFCTNKGNGEMGSQAVWTQPHLLLLCEMIRNLVIWLTRRDGTRYSCASSRAAHTFSHAGLEYIPEITTTHAHACVGDHKKCAHMGCFRSRFLSTNLTVGANANIRRNPILEAEYSCPPRPPSISTASLT